MSYVVQFNFPESEEPVYMGLAQGAAGFAPTTETALVFEDEESALRSLHNAYGAETMQYGRVIVLEPA